MAKTFLIWAAVFGFLSVALGAFGAHSLKAVLDEYGRQIWEKAVLYQMFHTLALLTTGILQNIFKDVNFNLAGYAFITGVILFSGSLYILALSNIKILGAVTPLGGIAFLTGWGFLAFKLFKL